MTLKLSTEKRELIERLLPSSLESLERQIGAQVPSKLRHHPPGSEQKEAKDWFQKHASELRERVCKSHTVKQLLKNDSNWEPISIVAAIIDGIGSPFFYGIPVTLLSVYLFKRGIKEFCSKC
jgi:hypothetical protein